MTIPSDQVLWRLQTEMTAVQDAEELTEGNRSVCSSSLSAVHKSLQQLLQNQEASTKTALNAMIEVSLPT